MLACSYRVQRSRLAPRADLDGNVKTSVVKPKIILGFSNGDRLRVPIFIDFHFFANGLSLRGSRGKILRPGLDHKSWKCDDPTGPDRPEYR